MAAVWQGAPWIGANFWSRTGGPRMWVRYDGGVVRQELAVLAAHGCNVTRSFCYWPDFVPAPGQLDEQVLERFSDFLAAHLETGLGTIPTFIVGHMSGENWDPSWRNGKDLYRDVWMVSQQAWFATEIARRFGQHKAVVGWLVSNEMPIYGGPATIEEITAWAWLIVNSIRSAGVNQPISLGDGAWGIEVSGNDNGYSLRSLAPIVDFAGPHVYVMSDDPVRQSMAAAVACELSAGFGIPVVLEEFGLSSDFASEENAAHYYRQVLHTTLLAGAKGWIAWNNCDYDDLKDQDPYRHHPFEMHFGITDRTGKPKAQLGELARFSALVGELSDGGWEPVTGDVAIIVPEHFERTAPLSTPDYRKDLRDNLAQSYIAAREADLPVGFVRERDGVGGGAKLYLLPSTKLLTAPTVGRLLSLAEAGATVYLSYFAGSTLTQRGPWFPWINETFGVRHNLAYGLADTVESDGVTFTFVEDLGQLSAGTQLRFIVSGSEGSRAFLPVAPDGARVLAVDDHGRPALLERRLGDGAMVLCTYPVEHMASRAPHANPEETWRLYSELARAAGVVLPLAVHDPRVMVGRLRGANKEVALVINMSAGTLQAKLETLDGAAYTSYGSGASAPVELLALPPYEVAVLARLG
jgi:endo-1,4-beta-mannosidase